MKTTISACIRVATAFVVAALAVGFAQAQAKGTAVGQELQNTQPVQFSDDADRRRDGRDRRNGAADGGSYAPLEMIIAQIQASTPGRLVGVRGPQDSNGRALYRIVWETPDGRVITLVVDAHSGQILGR